ncbi:hypothetical protein M7I_7981 [Glarea lozoyensis 74030]|uniref:PhoD-like phosphatase domain-containing protein n=1 Tax=Glarea lozoyensis (strain ATCC 74030 / MF5533) TaxID=1104152 RepID=H0EYS2_GLAL7|nr:hypothetical protein M7I_7981 [Glarea lozoyensis 74030]
MATGKKAVTGTYNLLGKVTSSAAGLVGGREAVASGFSQVKKAVGKSGLMGGVLNTFGDIDIADELRDISAVVAAPPPSYVLKMLHNNKPLYVPANGQKTTNQISDTKEDMMEIFQTDTNGGPREMKKLMGRRNYVAFVAYDPESINGGAMGNGSMHSGQNGLQKLSLAVDFVVQGDDA